MVGINRDILTRIASYVPENPVIYTNLAAVNREFYQIFTSDSLWKRINPHGVKKDLFQYFISQTTTIKDRACVKAMWMPHVSETWDIFRLFDETSNAYALLGYLCDHGWGELVENETLRGLLPEIRRVATCWLSIYPEAIMNAEAMPNWAYIAAASRNEYVLGCAPQQYLEDRSFVKEIVTKNGAALDFIEKFRDDDEIVALALESTLRAMPFVSTRLQKSYLENPEILARSVHICPQLIESHPRLCDNINVIKAAINAQQYGLYRAVGLKYASDRLKDDEELVEYAIRVLGNNIFYASKRLKTKERVMRAALNIQFQMAAFERYPGDIECITECLPTDLLEDKDVVKALVLRHGSVLQQLPQFSNDFDVAMAAAQSKYMRLHAVSPELKDDPEILHTAFKRLQSGEFYKMLPHEMKVDREVFECLDSLRPDDASIPEEILADKEAIIGLITRLKTPFSYFFKVPSRYSDDYDVAKTALAASPWALEGLSPRLRDDKELLRLAFSNDWMKQPLRCPMDFIGPETIKDSEFIRSLVAQVGTRSNALILENPEFLSLAVKKDPEAVGLINFFAMMLADRIDGFAENALKSNPRTFGYICADLLPTRWHELILGIEVS